ncbi:MAG: archaemetzincin family Zn-dependent metalloprotease [Candidatus Hadarchaeales archaeon]
MDALILFPIGNIEKSTVRKIADEVAKILSPFIKSCEIGQSHEIPSLAHDVSRNQYNAELLLDLLLPKIGGKDFALFITDADIFAHGMNFIFGLAQCPGNRGIVSIARLNPTFYGFPPDSSLLLERAVKEVVHEVGHLFGLGHCKDKRCVMRFSNTILEVDEKTSSFCKRCAGRLGQLRQPSQP